MALGSSAFLRYNNRLDFCKFILIFEKIKIKQEISNVYQYFSFLKILLSVFIPLKIAAFVNSGGHIGLRNSF
ncbi:hypothetical protein CAT59_17485 [Acinetobacter pittii]|jgi:hypothetical protein|uniref:Uncharacterized protein n=1 Tax=Acinetobacter pittii TaxID=48296 RepID=A0A242TZM5_ACIPI|nr:hypothetical protein CAT59_17485 [Acinetobacter pittii]